MVEFGAKDNTPDVKIKSTTYQHRLTEDGPEAEFETRVHYEVHCRFCGGYYMTPDVRSAVKWADSHEASEAHGYAKEERDNPDQYLGTSTVEVAPLIGRSPENPD